MTGRALTDIQAGHGESSLLSGPGSSLAGLEGLEVNVSGDMPTFFRASFVVRLENIVASLGSCSVDGDPGGHQGREINGWEQSKLGIKPVSGVFQGNGRAGMPKARGSRGGFRLIAHALIPSRLGIQTDRPRETEKASSGSWAFPQQPERAEDVKRLGLLDTGTVTCRGSLGPCVSSRACVEGGLGCWRGLVIGWGGQGHRGLEFPIWGLVPGNLQGASGRAGRCWSGQRASGARAGQWKGPQWFCGLV